MSDKELPERMGIAETKLDTLTRRMDDLELARKNYQEKRERNLITGMWLCLRLMALTTVLTMTTPKMREGLEKFWGYLFP